VTELRPQVGDLPRARPSPMTAPFWSGCAAGELRYQRCTACGQANFPPTVTCRHCHQRTVAWAISTGRGSIYSWTVVWRPVQPSFTVPYAVAIVDVDDGFRMISNIVDCDAEKITSGMRVEVIFHAPNDEFVIPYFRPLTAAEAMP
jgi:uncharacterized protein